MAVYINANSFDEITYHPLWERDSGAIGGPVKKEKLEDFFPEAMKQISYDYASVEIFKSKLDKLIRGVLEDMGSIVKSELAQFDRDEEARKRTIANFEKIIATMPKESHLYPMHDNGIKFVGIPSTSKSPEEQRKLLALATYNKHLKHSILSQIDREHWFSLPALKMLGEREKEISQLYADAEIYETKVKYSAVNAALSVASVAAKVAKNAAKTNAIKKAAASVFFNKVSESVATKSLMTSTLSISRKYNAIDFLGNSSGVGLMLSEKKQISAKKENSGSTAEPIDCMRPINIKGVPLGALLQFEPHVGFAAGVVNMGLNNLAAMHTYKSITAIHESISSYFQKMSQIIQQDFEKLDEKEIDTLIENVFKINIKEYIPL